MLMQGMVSPKTHHGPAITGCPEAITADNLRTGSRGAELGAADKAPAHTVEPARNKADAVIFQRFSIRERERRRVRLLRASVCCPPILLANAIFTHQRISSANRLRPPTQNSWRTLEDYGELPVLHDVSYRNVS